MLNLVLAPVLALALHTGGWQVKTAETWMDSVITVPLAKDTVERAWCAEATIDRDSKVITITSIIEAPNQRVFTNVQEEGFGVQFACPKGSIPIHSHLGNRHHPHGPSQGDRAAFFHFQPQPPFALIAFRELDGTVTLIPYGI